MGDLSCAPQPMPWSSEDRQGVFALRSAMDSEVGATALIDPNTVAVVAPTGIEAASGSGQLALDFHPATTDPGCTILIVVTAGLTANHLIGRVAVTVVGVLLVAVIVIVVMAIGQRHRADNAQR